MPRTQRIETKRTFMAAWGQLLMLMRDELSELDQEEAVDEFESMIKQVHAFFVAEAVRDNLWNS